MVSPRNVTCDLPVEHGEHFLEVVPVRRRPAARRDVHVDEGVPAGGVIAGDEDRVGVADEPDVRQALIFVRPGHGELARRVVGRDRSRLEPACCRFDAGLADESGKVRRISSV